MKNENKNLILKVIIICLVLFGLGIYDYYTNGDEYRLKLRKSSQWNLGGIYVKSFNDSTFYAEGYSDTIVGINYKKFLSEGETLKKGDLLKIRSVHLGGDTVDIKFMKISRNRNSKIWLSVIPFLLVLSLFFKYFKFDKNIKRYREK